MHRQSIIPLLQKGSNKCCPNSQEILISADEMQKKEVKEKSLYRHLKMDNREHKARPLTNKLDM